MPDSAKPVRAELIEGVALLTINVPPRNAPNDEDWVALAEAIGHAAANPSVRVVVVTGAGHHAFANGADERVEAASRAAAALSGCGKPSVARIRGTCTGAGLVLALHADMVVAAIDSAFALPGTHARMHDATLAALVRRVGPQHARRLALTGERIGAEEALRIGLVMQVVADEDLSDAVAALVRGIVDAPHHRVSDIRRAIDATA